MILKIKVCEEKADTVFTISPGIIKLCIYYKKAFFLFFLNK